MAATIDDLARIMRTALNTQHTHVRRITLHPSDFEAIASSAVFVPTVPTATQVPCRGHIWGVSIYVNPRNEPNIAYVVTREGDGERGAAYKIVVADEPKRKTAWARILEDD